ncbi:hypothetical protein HY345_03320 [Candidatus Microgenomates bacterium]|nr:hypothetical protein [Candidatus Microgenomates bacterium]
MSENKTGLTEIEQRFSPRRASGVILEEGTVGPAYDPIPFIRETFRGKNGAVSVEQRGNQENCPIVMEVDAERLYDFVCEMGVKLPKNGLSLIIDYQDFQEMAGQTLSSGSPLMDVKLPEISHRVHETLAAFKDFLMGVEPTDGVKTKVLNKNRRIRAASFLRKNISREKISHGFTNLKEAVSYYSSWFIDKTLSFAAYGPVNLSKNRIIFFPHQAYRLVTHQIKSDDLFGSKEMDAGLYHETVAQRFKEYLGHETRHVAQKNRHTVLSKAYQMGVPLAAGMAVSSVLQIGRVLGIPATEHLPFITSATAASVLTYFTSPDEIDARSFGRQVRNGTNFDQVVKIGIRPGFEAQFQNHAEMINQRFKMSPLQRVMDVIKMDYHSA